LPTDYSSGTQEVEGSDIRTKLTYLHFRGSPC
jgi:hypothetical protein